VDDRTSRFVAFVLDCGVVSFGEFVTRSGRRTPYFVDSGRFRTGGQLAELGRFYAAAIDEAFGDGVDTLFGPAYKGIPLAVSTAIALHDHHGHEVGVCFDRKEAKDHGEGGELIGAPLRDGDRVVIVEDVTTAGTSVRASVPRLRAVAEVEVVGLVVGVDRRERGTREDVSALDELGASFGLKTVALATIDDVVDHLTEPGSGRSSLSAEDLARFSAYRADHGVSSPT